MIYSFHPLSALHVSTVFAAPLQVLLICGASRQGPGRVSESQRMHLRVDHPARAAPRAGLRPRADALRQGPARSHPAAERLARWVAQLTRCR